MRAAASRMAAISACAVGSTAPIGWLKPRPTISPSTATTAPIGTSPASRACRASASASAISRSKSIRGHNTAVLQSTRPDRDRPASLKASTLPFVTIAAITLAARLPFLLRADRFFDADEAVEGLMARHVLAGEHPLFLWGQRYKGVPEIYLDAAVFRFTGSSVSALKAVTLACFVVFLCLNFVLLDRLFSRRIAWMATAFLIAGPPTLVLWTLSGSAEIVMTFLAGAVLLLAIERWLRPATLVSPRV